jgi:hypothetical protein
MLFLIGAGFNIDANHEASPLRNRYYGNRIDCGYPLVSDVLKLCFGRDDLPKGKSAEELFSEALQKGDLGPMEKLVERLMEADYYIALRLAASETSNSYRRFFEKFNDAQILTYNYDSLPEIFLARDGRWSPEDGYGMPVATELTFGLEPIGTKSSSLVIHLHGSACVYSSEFEIIGNPAGGMAQLAPRQKTLYAFDADALSPCFPRYRRMMSRTGHVRVEERVLAPIPDKSKGLDEPFIRQSYATALPLVRQLGTLAAVGYSFNHYDRLSYHRILEALGQSKERTLFIVSPQARELAKRISQEYSDLCVRPVERTFKGWAADSFRID